MYTIYSKILDSTAEIDARNIDEVKGVLSILVFSVIPAFEYSINPELLTEENIKLNGCGMTFAYSDDIEIYVNHKETACNCDDFTHIGELYRNRGVK